MHTGCTIGDGYTIHQVNQGKPELVQSLKSRALRVSPFHQPVSVFDRKSRNHPRTGLSHTQTAFGIDWVPAPGVPTYTHAYSHTYIHTYLPTYQPTYIHTYTNTCVRTHTHIHPHIQTHNTHAHRHAYMSARVFPSPSVLTRSAACVFPRASAVWGGPLGVLPHSRAAGHSVPAGSKLYNNLRRRTLPLGFGFWPAARCSVASRT